MTFRDYILPIVSRTGRSQKTTINEIFRYAGYKNENEISKSTCASWIAKEEKGKPTGKFRKCHGEKFFPTRKIDDENLVDYFCHLPNFDWESLQKEYAKKENCNYIDTVTKDINRFFWSMVRQFQAILNLDLSDYPDEVDAYLPTRSLKKETKTNGYTWHIARDLHDAVETIAVTHFLETEPDSLLSYQVWDASRACGTIKKLCLEKEKPYGDKSDYFGLLGSFYNGLEKYLLFLKKHSSSALPDFPDNMKFPENDHEFNKQASKYRADLTDLLKQIVIGLEETLNKEESARREETRKLICNPSDD